MNTGLLLWVATEPVKTDAEETAPTLNAGLMALNMLKISPNTSTRTVPRNGIVLATR